MPEHKVENTQFQRTTILDPVHEEPLHRPPRKKSVGWRGWLPQLPEVECTAKAKKELLNTLATRLREALQAHEDAWDKQLEADIEAGKLEKEIAKHVYALYNLTQEEIPTVEEEK